MQSAFFSCTYRIYNSSRDVYQQDCDDDGETAAGGRLLHLLQVREGRDGGRREWARVKSLAVCLTDYGRSRCSCRSD